MLKFESIFLELLLYNNIIFFLLNLLYFKLGCFTFNHLRFKYLMYLIMKFESIFLNFFTTITSIFFLLLKCRPNYNIFDINRQNIKGIQVHRENARNIYTDTAYGLDDPN